VGNLSDETTVAYTDITPPTFPTSPPVVTDGPNINTATPEIHGSCEAGNKVTLFIDDIAVAPTVVCQDDGIFSVTLENPLSDGIYNVTMQEEDQAGNRGPKGPNPAVTMVVDTHIDVPTLTTNVESNGTLTIYGESEQGSTVQVTFPDGTVKTVTADTEGRYSATSDTPQPTGDIKVEATDEAGNVAEPAKTVFTQWYREDDSNGTTFIYGDEEIHEELQTTIQISPELIIEREEGVATDSNVRLHISTVTPEPAPAIFPEVTPGCDTDSYSAFITLFKEKGEVETGYSYADSACGGQSDATTFDGQRLRFVPGTEARLHKTEEKGGMVIIIDTDLKKAITFGER
jgi:hypothetical protein